MASPAAVDVLLVSLGSTHGLRAADEQLRDSLQRAGATVVLASARPPRPLRTMALTDFAWALGAQAAAQRALADVAPRAVIYSSTTAGLLWPRPGAIRFDALSQGNRPGRHGVWQRPLERRRLTQATLLLPWSEGALSELPPASHSPTDRALVLPVAVATSGEAEKRDIAAITYAANPAKKGLDRVLAAWKRVTANGSADGELVVAGVHQHELEDAGFEVHLPGVRVVGPLPQEQYRALLRRARVFVCAPRREDYGIAQLEALVDGCMLVTTSAPGPYVALPIARQLDARLVTEDLAGALRAALLEPQVDYAAKARCALEPFGAAAVDAVAAEALARLLG